MAFGVFWMVFGWFLRFFETCSKSLFGYCLSDLIRCSNVFWMVLLLVVRFDQTGTFF